MPLKMPKSELDEAAKKKHELWICHYGAKNARNLSKRLYGLFREDRKREKEYRELEKKRQKRK